MCYTRIKLLTRRNNIAQKTNNRRPPHSGGQSIHRDGGGGLESLFSLLRYNIIWVLHIRVYVRTYYYTLSLSFSVSLSLFLSICSSYPFYRARVFYCAQEDIVSLETRRRVFVFPWPSSSTTLLCPDGGADRSQKHSGLGAGITPPADDGGVGKAIAVPLSIFPACVYNIMI